MKQVKYWSVRPQVWLALVSLLLLAFALANYPIGSVAASSMQSLVQPSRDDSQKSPVIVGARRVTGQSGSGAQGQSKPMLALSFDDGPNPLTTPLILNTLEEYHVHASFFVVGSRVAGNEAILRREYADGDDIGNHSWSHPNFAGLNEQEIAGQITRTEKAIAAAGVPAPFMFRPPYGVLGPHFPNKLPLAVILWNIDPKDWADHNAPSLTNRIISEARPGGIVDMHGIYLATAQAIGPAIAVLEQKYRLVTVSELLNIHPGTTGKYYGY